MNLPVAPVSFDLLRRQQARIRGLVRRLAGPDEVDDVEQEVWVAALERPPRAWVALPAWVTTTVRNMVAKRRRSASRRAAREQAAASPESLPSSAELVTRVELEEFVLRCVRELPEPEREVVLLRFFEEMPTAAVAARLGLGESTARARLQRAIERLRARLDKRAGSRRRWMRVLAPWSVAAAGSTLVAVKSAAIVAAIAAGVGLAFVATLDEKLPVASKTFYVGADGAIVEGEPPPDAAEPERAPEPALVESKPASPFPDPEAERLGVPGRVRFAVVDAASGATLRDVTVRLLSEARFGTIDAPDVVDRALSAGTWEMVVLRDGYEPETRAGVVIRAGVTTDLGIVALERGRGGIEGKLRCDGVAGGTPRFVELRGAGRSPCPRCGLGEECCGYAWDLSLVRVGEDGRFRFSGLAAGTYFVRPYDERPRLQPTLRVELARDERRELDVTLAAPVTLRFETLDALGAPFVGLWASDREERAEPIHVDLEVDGVRTGFDATPDVADLRRALGPPLRLGEAVAEPEVGAFASRRSTQIFHWSARVDRERAADDTLLPPVETPFYGKLELGCGRLGPNRYFVRELPACRVSVRAHCGELVADDLELDLDELVRAAAAEGSEPTIRLLFRAREP
jgi:RNA polymerase sigma-70 factor (ECF subfamily)